MSIDKKGAKKREITMQALLREYITEKKSSTIFWCFISHYKQIDTFYFDRSTKKKETRNGMLESMLPLSYV